ncbi:hypothetical protein FRC0493_01995 [Corynebacterium diphtheriae]|nr:hypothetical protein FRC0493_01995 [Corynebacterium diphtheriae]
MRFEFSQFLFSLLYFRAKLNQLAFYEARFNKSSFSLVKLCRLLQTYQSSFFSSELKGAGVIIIDLDSHGIRRRNNRTRGDDDGSEGRE